MLDAAQQFDSVKITFELHLTELTEARWETLLLKKRLYIQVPSCLLPEGSKEGLVVPASCYLHYMHLGYTYYQLD